MIFAEPAMIFPCIDLQDGRVVQLEQGRTRRIEERLTAELLGRFAGFPQLQVIDLDAAMERGENRELVGWLARRVVCRVGGGVRGPERARELVEAGAAKVIVGTAAFTPHGVDRVRLGEIADAAGKERVIVALDSRAGRIVVRGWTEALEVTAAEVLQELAPYCAGFLCTHVDAEGLMRGTDIEWFRQLRQATPHEITAAGGVASLEETRSLLEIPVHVALGMAIYTGRLNLGDLRRLLESTRPAVAP